MKLSEEMAKFHPAALIVVLVPFGLILIGLMVLMSAGGDALEKQEQCSKAETDLQRVYDLWNTKCNEFSRIGCHEESRKEIPGSPTFSSMWQLKGCSELEYACKIIDREEERVENSCDRDGS